MTARFLSLPQIRRPDWSLDPGTACAVRIYFDPAFRNDHQSALIKSKLAISYLEAPQKDSLDLVAEVNYPNLQLDTTTVDFSSVLIDTVRRRHVTIKNVSKVPCRFQWSFLDIRDATDGAEAEGPAAARTKSSLLQSAAQSVDILPLSGELAPGQSETVEFCFFAHPGTKLDAVALCEVLGGPEYEVKLTGEASTVKYSLDTNLIDIGSVPFDKVIEKELILQNLGRVPFEWRVNLAKLSRPGVVVVSSSQGSLGPNQREVLRMRVKAGVPDRLSEVVLIEVAHCESETVTVIGEGVYPSCVLTLPRQPEDDYAALLEEARQRLVQRGPASGLGHLKTGGVGFAAGTRDPAGAGVKAQGSVASRMLSRNNSMKEPDSAKRTLGGASTINLRAGRPASPDPAVKRASVPDLKHLGLPTEYVPTAAEVEVEADRLKLCHALVMQSAMSNATARITSSLPAQASTATLGPVASSVSMVRGATLASVASTAALPQEASMLLMDVNSSASNLRQEASIASAPGSPGPKQTGKNVVSWNSVAQYVRATGKPVAGHYILDFGFMTKGTTRTKKFRVQNTSSQPIYFMMDKKVLTTGNLVAEPEAVSKLPGAPEYASVPVAITFNTAKSSVQPGPMSCLVPIDVKGGPTIMITVRAVVVVPELRISREVLDFGPVQSGLCKVIALQLHNPKDVACEWSVRKPTEGVQDWSYFQLRPDAGTIPPGGRIHVKAVFTPNRGKERNYSQRIPIRVNYNAKQLLLAATGSALCPRATLSVTELDLGPTIPRFEGQQPKRAYVELHNPCAQPIEVFCVETDQQFREEEDILRQYSVRFLASLPCFHICFWLPLLLLTLFYTQLSFYRSNCTHTQGFETSSSASTLMMPIRPPGAPFWPAIIEAHKAALAAAAEQADQPEEPEIETQPSFTGSRAGSISPTRGGLGGAHASDRSLLSNALVGDLEPVSKDKSPMYFLVLGDETILTEKTDIVKGLEKRYKLPTVSLESLLSSLRTREHLPESLAALLAEPSLEEEQLTQLLTEALTGTDPDALDNGLLISSLKSTYAPREIGLRALLKAMGLRPVEDPKVDAAAAAAKGKPAPKGKGKEEPAPVHEVTELAWEGDRVVRTIVMSVDPAEFSRRRRQALVAQQALEPAGAPPPPVNPPTPAPGPPPRTTSSVRGPLPAAAPPRTSMADRVSSAGGTAPAAPADSGLEANFEEQIAAEWKEYQAQQKRLVGMITPPASSHAPPTKIELIPAKVSPSVTGAEMFKEIVGFQWTLDQLKTRLPGVESDRYLSPPDYLMHVVHRPATRFDRLNAGKYFKVLTLGADDERRPLSTPPMGAKSPAPAKGKGKDESATSSAGHGGAQKEQTRWVIPAQGVVKLEVHFQSGEVGSFAESFTFEVMDGLADAHPVLHCAGTCSYPSISRDYRNVFYRKVKAKPVPQAVSKQYIIATDTFDFGPLLFIAKKPEKDYHLAGHSNPDCMTKMRITNSGSFDALVDFKLKSTNKALGTVFAVYPESMELKPDETQELQVFAFPTADGHVEDTLECNIKDNPQPTTFSLACTGAKPQLKIEGPDAKGAVAFERLLLGKKEQKQLSLSNASLLPLIWELEGADKLPAEVTVSPQRGELPAMTDQHVLVEFTAIESRTVSVPLKLKVFDVKKSQPVVQDVPIAIQGEAFELKIKTTFPDADDSKQAVDFGVLRVVEDREKEILLENTGKYAVGFRFVFAKSSVLKEFVSILGPDGKLLTGEGQVDPGKKMAVKLHFNRTRSLQHEVSVRDNYDLSLQYIEKLTNTVEQKVPIKVDVVAVFSKYSITPARGLSFGPTTYRTQSKPRIFEVQNLGVFPFDFRAFDSKNPPAPEELSSAFARPSTASGKKDDKGKKKDDKKGDGATGPPLTVGSFVVEPGNATIAPGTTLQVKVTFNAEGDKGFLETIGLHISERDFTDHPTGMLYELSGDSCIPGINAQDVETIFEEHRLLNSMDPFNPIPLAFYKRERLFDFGPVVAQLSDTASEDAKAAAGKAPAAKAPPPAKGQVAEPPALTEDEEERSRGVRANLRISNPSKVPCSVQFSIQPRGDATNFPMSVWPLKVDIPPHEYRYISVRFAPAAIQSYAAVFEAKVENGGDPKTSSFQCELRGEGVLPHVTVLEPTTRTPAGRPLLKFNRLLVGREQSLPLVLRNDGSLPASYRLDSPSSAAFRITGGPPVGTLEPRTTAEYLVTFAPKTTDTLTHGIGLMVKHNQFEKVVIDCVGEGFREDIIFEGLPGDVEGDQLQLPDTAVGEHVRLAFNLRNLSQDKVFRFAWASEPPPPPPETKATKGKAAPPPPAAVGLPPGLELSPSVGHLHPGASKLIMVTFRPAAKVTIKEHPVPLKIEEIALAEGLNADDWDDKAVVVEFDDEGVERSKVKEEPKHTPTPGSGKSLTLKVSAAADLSRYQSETAPIAFKPTMMFQTRTFAFPLKNLGDARMPFAFEVQHLDGTPDIDGFYSVEPIRGEVEAGKEVSITVKFAPTEVEDCTRQLVCTIPYLAEGVAPFVRQLTGRVQRPWAHLDLPESDYLSSGRRNPEMRGPSGSLGPLDPATRVLEFESLGFRIRNTKRFFVLNPTSIAYEFVWERAVLPDERPSPFRCQVVRGTIGGGKRFEMVFDYTPEEDELRESHWLFRIPEQGISVPFLLVGNVKEPAVAFDRSAIAFGMIQVGAKGREILNLINSEDLPFTFVFDKESYDATEQRVLSTGKRPLLDFEPYCGTVPPKSSFPISVTYAPTEATTINYGVLVNVRKKPSRLTLNVKGEGFLIKESVRTNELGSTK